MALAVLAALTLAGCSGVGKGRLSAADGETDETAVTGEQSVKPARSMEELSKALEISVPEGYLLQPDDMGDAGPSDLEKAVRDDGGDDAREVLTRTGFVRGHQRMWSRSGDDEIIAYVYQFADRAGALEYTSRLTAEPATQTNSQTGGAGTEKFTVPAITGSVGVSGSDAAFATSSVFFVKGPYSVQMVVNSSSPTGLPPIASALAEEQYSHL